MNTILTIFKKELTDTLRDRRTIITMIVIPVLLFPIIFSVMTKIGESQAKKAKEKILCVTVIAPPEAADFYDILSKQDDITLVRGIPEDSITTFIRSDSLDGAYVFADNFAKRLRQERAGVVEMFYKTTDSNNITKNRLKTVLEKYQDILLEKRLEKYNLKKSFLKTVTIKSRDVATKREKFGKIVGGFMPYIFVIFCFMGAMYPAIDLGAGEKERGTIETLLTSPANRFQILVGKFMVVVVTGVASAAVSIFGLYLGVRQAVDIPQELMQVLSGVFETSALLMVLSLLLPLTIFFGGILLSLSVYARSFKEAQSLISPGTVLVILPAAVGLIPGITLNFVTALVPVLNVSLATKEIMAGTVDPLLLGVVYLSLIVYAGLSLWFCTYWFSKESVIFRS